MITVILAFFVSRGFFKEEEAQFILDTLAENEVPLTLEGTVAMIEDVRKEYRRWKKQSDSKKPSLLSQIQKPGKPASKQQRTTRSPLGRATSAGAEDIKTSRTLGSASASEDND